MLDSFRAKRSAYGTAGDVRLREMPSPARSPLHVRFPPSEIPVNRRAPDAVLRPGCDKRAEFGFGRPRPEVPLRLLDRADRLGPPQPEGDQCETPRLSVPLQGLGKDILAVPQERGRHLARRQTRQLGIVPIAGLLERNLLPQFQKLPSHDGKVVTGADGPPGVRRKPRQRPVVVFNLNSAVEILA